MSEKHLLSGNTVSRDTSLVTEFTEDRRNDVSPLDIFGERFETPFASPISLPSATSAFHNYSVGDLFQRKDSGAFTGKKGVVFLTVHLVATYKRVSSEFDFTDAAVPRRVLTNPHTPISEALPHDNRNGDYIFTVNEVLSAGTANYRVVDLLGSGTFGQVVKCIDEQTGKFVAIKAIKNRRAYRNQARVEIQILQVLATSFSDVKNTHVVRLLSHFEYREHLFLVFELLDINLYELLKQNGMKGLSMNLVRSFCKQITKGLIVLEKAKVIHCDLKPENILLRNMRLPELRLIDVGSACFEEHTMYSYIQSRFYRSPEVILGLPYTRKIDVWSLGCICAELFLGIPIFPGCSEHNQLCRIMEMVGEPPREMLVQGKNVKKFFHVMSKKNGEVKWRLKSEEEYCRDNSKPLKSWKRYFAQTKLPDFIYSY